MGSSATARPEDEGGRETCAPEQRARAEAGDADRRRERGWQVRRAQNGQHLPEYLRIRPPRLVAIPFTSPMLAGVRLRRTPDNRYEFLVPNPAGGVGYYVVEGEALRRLCRLTLHDEVLLERLLEQPAITPRVVREVALEVAGMGLAGRRVAEAASAAKGRRISTKHAEAMLLLMLLRELQVPMDRLMLASRSRDMRALARRELVSRVDRLNLSAEQVLESIEEIAPRAAALGFPEPRAGLYAQVLDRLGRLARALRRWAAPEAGEVASIATRVADTAEFVRRIAGRLLRACRRRILPVSELVVLWSNEPLVRRMFEDLEWWLEGWEDPASRFFAALRQDREYQNAVVRELGRHVLPVRAVETGARIRIEPLGDSVRSCYVKRYRDWRTGLVATEWLERLEAARAEALQ